MQNVKKSRPLIFGAILFLLCAPMLGAATPTLDEVEVVGQFPSEILMADPVSTPNSGPSGGHSSNGALTHEFADSLPLPISDYGNRPGAAGQLRGLGRSSTEIDVQAFGLPLNPPQGGGFDFSTLPQFLWSRSSIVLGPSLASSDPAASSGSVTLTPWTTAALEERGDHVRLMEDFVPARGQRSSQVSMAGASAKTQSAAVLGYSSGIAHGPSGILSTQVVDQEHVRASLHFLGTQIQTAVTGPSNAPTPFATQTTFRVIPVGEVEAGRVGETYFKSSLFYDSQVLRTDDPTQTSAHSFSRAEQSGQQSVLLKGPWKFGIGTRSESYQDLAVARHTEEIVNLRASRTFISDSWLIEPVAQLVAVSDYNAAPGASLGVRKEWSQHAATFIRASYSSKFPSLLDRYYQSVSYSGNPDLKVEHDGSVLSGVEFNTDAFEFAPQAYVQYRRQAIVTTGLPTASNVGDSWIAGLMWVSTVHALEVLDLGADATYVRSRVLTTGDEFPYQPEWTGLARIEFHDHPHDSRWKLQIMGRAVTSSAVQAQGPRLPAYGYVDLKGQITVWSGSVHSALAHVDLYSQLEDALDRKFETVQYYPNPGRVWTVGMSGEF